MLIYSKYSQVSRRAFRRLSPRKVGLTLLVATTVLLVLLKVVSWLNAQEMFALKDILVEGNRFVADEEILNLLHVDSSQTLFEVDLKALAERAQRHPWVKHAWASRRLPDNVVIKVLEHEPLALLHQEDGLTILDERGVYLPDLPQVTHLDVPIISGVARLAEGSDKRKLQTILAFLRQTRLHDFALYSQISEIAYDRGLGLYFYLIDQTVPVILGEGNLAPKTQKLMEVLQLIKREKDFSRIKCIDLRYRGQVIVKEQSS